MDNNQPTQLPNAQYNPMQGFDMQSGSTSTTPAQPGIMTTNPTQPGGMASHGAQVIEKPIKRDVAGLVKTIVIIILSLIALTFIGLFIWIFSEYDRVQLDVNGQIEEAVAEAKDEQAAKDEAEFLQREKYPYRTFKGPADYGELTFEYPKTWSVYVEADATKGGDYYAFFNPIEVSTVSDDTINALRVSILTTAYDEVVADYQRDVERRDSNLVAEAVEYNGIPMMRYTGTIPGTELSGIIVVFKIRDKTVVMQTDSMLFEGDYTTLLNSVTFNA